MFVVGLLLMLKTHLIQRLQKGIGDDEAFWVASGVEWVRLCGRGREWEGQQGRDLNRRESKKDVWRNKNWRPKQKTMFCKSWGQLELRTHFNPQNANNIFTPNNALGWHHYWNQDCTGLLPCMMPLISAMPSPSCFALHFYLKEYWTTIELVRGMPIVQHLHFTR